MYSARYRLFRVEILQRSPLEMLLTRVLPLLVQTPVSPDSYACSYIYGENIIPSACQRLVDSHWPTGNEPMRVYFRDPPGGNYMNLPYTLRGAGCSVSIEYAGPNAGITHYVKISPNELRGLAAYVIQKCPIEHNGIGGFGTVGLDNAVTFVRQWGSSNDASDRNDTGGFPWSSIRIFILTTRESRFTHCGDFSHGFRLWQAWS